MDETLDYDADGPDGTPYVFADIPCVRCGRSSSSEGEDGPEGRKCRGCLEIERRLEITATPEWRELEAEDPELASRPSRPEVIELAHRRLQVRRLRDHGDRVRTGRAAQLDLAPRRHKALREEIGRRFSHYKNRKGR